MITVTENALRKRLARKLRHESAAIKKTRRPVYTANDVGPYYVIDDRNIIRDWGEIEDLASRNGVIGHNETYAPHGPASP